MGKLNKFQKDAIREMADLISDLALLGIEGEIKEEELVGRAQRMIRHSEFRELFPKFVQDAFNPEQDEDDNEEEINFPLGNWVPITDEDLPKHLRKIAPGFVDEAALDAFVREWNRSPIRGMDVWTLPEIKKDDDNESDNKPTP